MKFAVFLFILSLTLLCNARFDCGKNWIHTSTTPNQNKRASFGERQMATGNFNINLNVLGSAPASFIAEFQTAIQIWEDLLANTNLTEEINIDLSVEQLPSGVLGATNTVDLVALYDGVGGYRDAIEAHTGETFPSRDEVVNNANIPIGASFSPNGAFVVLQKPQLKALGFVGVDAMFGPSDGEITFSSEFSFDTDASDGISGNQIDFLSVAVHEIGHLLGFTSVVDSIDAGINVFPIGALDFFRFFSQDAFTGFITSPRHLNPNGVNFHIMRDFNGIMIGEMSQGVNAFPQTSPESNQASHWRDNANSGQETIGIMDPTLDFGEALGTSEADDQAMFFLGYTPDPAVAPTLVSALVGSDTVTLQGFNFRPPVTCDILSNVTFTNLPATLLDGNGIAVVDVNAAVSITGTAVCRNANSGDSNIQGLAEGSASLLAINFVMFASMTLLLLGL